MALTLRLRSGDVHPEPEIPFDAPRVVVGRARGCDLQLPDPSISPRHASLRQRGSEYVVVDEGSDNGTFLGALRLPRHASHPVQHGDLLRFGRVWVEVRIGPAEQALEVQASREIARRLVDAALDADGVPSGMLVSCEGRDLALRLDEPRRPYSVGSKKGSDLRLPSGSPGRCLELRRQGDQLWLTLQEGATAALGERPLVAGERTAWPKGAVLALDGLRFTFSDPTAQMLDRLEREPTERLPEGAPIDPPSGVEDEGDAEEDDWEEEAPEEDGDEADVELAAPAAPAVRRAPRAAPLREPRPGWTRADALLLLLAMSILALSLWAIRWLSHLGTA